MIMYRSGFTMNITQELIYLIGVNCFYLCGSKVMVMMYDL